MYSSQRWSSVCAVVCVYIHALRDHSLCKLWGDTTTDCTHWNPQAPILHPSISPSYLCFVSPRCCPSTYRGHRLQRVHPSTHSLHPPPASFHPPVSSRDLPNAFQSFVLVRHSPASLTAQLEHLPMRNRLFGTSFLHPCRVQDSGKNYYPAWYLLHLSCTALKSKTSNQCLFSLNAGPAPSPSSRLQTSNHRALIGGLRGNSYHTAII